jgi:cytidylate kinase
MTIQDLTPEAADRRRAQFDRAHEAYFRQFYGVQIRDPALYHLVIDSTSIEPGACVDIIARAAESLEFVAAGMPASGPRS